MTEEQDPRNARSTDPWTSAAGTAGISMTHKVMLAAFLAEFDRPQGWTTGEIKDALDGLGHPNIWRRMSDLHRDGIAECVPGPLGEPLVRVYRGTGRPERAHRIKPLAKEVPVTLTADERIKLALAEYAELAVLAPLRAQSPLVPGSGPLNAPVMLVGEAPGAQEVVQLEPFVGPSGRLLNTLLAAAGLPRRYCYTTNVLLYRPPMNRTPERFEIAASRERLLAEIEAIQPMLIITLGAVARRALKPQGDPVSVCHGKPEPLGFIWNQDHQPGDPIALEAEVSHVCTMVPTYHPSAALRDPEIHAKMREDLAFLRQFA